MQKISFIFTLLFSIITFVSPSYGEWKFVIQNQGGSNFYVETDKLRKHDGNIFVWELVDFLKPDSTGYLSAGKYIQLDCKLLRFKYLSFAFYKQPMGNGTPEVSKPIKQLQGWKYSPPNTTQEYVKKFICNL